MFDERFGPTALVTGASSGLGEGFARELAGRGLDLVLAARRHERLQSLAEELRATHGVSTQVVVVDLATAGAAEQLLAATADLDIGLVVSNAGASRPGLFLEHGLEAIRERMRLNAASHVELAHGFARRMTHRDHSGLLLVSALGATEGIPYMADSAGSKALVASLGRSLHHELREHGITVSVMLPGNVDTPILDAFALDRDALPMSPYPIERAVIEALDALARGRSSIIPDRRMRLMMGVTPRDLRVRMNGRMMGRAAAALTARESR